MVFVICRDGLLVCRQSPIQIASKYLIVETHSLTILSLPLLILLLATQPGPPFVNNPCHQFCCLLATTDSFPWQFFFLILLAILLNSTARLDKFFQFHIVLFAGFKGLKCLLRKLEATEVGKIGGFATKNSVIGNMR